MGAGTAVAPGAYFGRSPEFRMNARKTHEFSKGLIKNDGSIRALVRFHAGVRAAPWQGPISITRFGQPWRMSAHFSGTAAERPPYKAYVRTSVSVLHNPGFRYGPRPSAGFRSSYEEAQAGPYCESVL